MELRESNQKKSRNLVSFNANLERSRALMKNKKGGNLFLSTRQDFTRGPGALSISVKGPTYNTVGNKNY